MKAVKEKVNNSTLLPKPKPTLIKIIMSALPIIVIIVSLIIFQWLAVYGIIFVSIGLAALKMYQNRETLKIGIAAIETAIWGSPYEKGVKRPKVKFVWNKRVAYERDRKERENKDRAKNRRA